MQETSDVIMSMVGGISVKASFFLPFMVNDAANEVKTYLNAKYNLNAKHTLYAAVKISKQILTPWRNITKTTTVTNRRVSYFSAHIAVV